MIRALMVLLAVTTLPLAAAAAELYPPVAVDRASPLATEIDGYLRDAPRFDDRPYQAASTGGPMGWLLVQVHVWYPSLGGEMTSNTDVLDFEDDLGITDREFSFMPVIQASLGGIGLRLDGFFLDYDGQNTLTRTFEFGGITFTVSENVATEISIDYLRLTSLIPVVKTDPLTLYIEAGLAWVALEGTITGSISGTATESASVPLPLLGALLQGRVGRFVFELDVCGFTLSYEDLGATLLDVEASVGINVVEFLGVRAGYRFVYAEGDADLFHIEALLEGFFVGATFQF